MTSKASTGSLPPALDTSGPEAHAPNKKQGAIRAILAALAAAIAVAALLFAIRLLRRPPELLVTAAHVEDVTRVLAVTGRVEAERTVLVTPQFVGRLTEIVRHEGDRVKAGEVIARIADTAAKSEVRQAQANLSARQKDLEQGRRDLARTNQLVASGSSAAAELETAQLAVSRASDDVRRLDSRDLEYGTRRSNDLADFSIATHDRPIEGSQEHELRLSLVKDRCQSHHVCAGPRDRELGRLELDGW